MPFEAGSKQSNPTFLPLLGGRRFVRRFNARWRQDLFKEPMKANVCDNRFSQIQSVMRFEGRCADGRQQIESVGFLNGRLVIATGTKQIVGEPQFKGTIRPVTAKAACQWLGQDRSDDDGYPDASFNPSAQARLYRLLAKALR